MTTCRHCTNNGTIRRFKNKDIVPLCRKCFRGWRAEYRKRGLLAGDCFYCQAPGRVARRNHRTIFLCVVCESTHAAGLWEVEVEVDEPPTDSLNDNDLKVIECLESQVLGARDIATKADLGINIISGSVRKLCKLGDLKRVTDWEDTRKYLYTKV